MATQWQPRARGRLTAPPPSAREYTKYPAPMTPISSSGRSSHLAARRPGLSRYSGTTERSRVLSQKESTGMPRMMAKSKLLKNSSGKEEKKDWKPAVSKIRDRDTVVTRESMSTTRMYLTISSTVFSRTGRMGSFPSRRVYHSL